MARLAPNRQQVDIPAQHPAGQQHAPGPLTHTALVNASCYKSLPLQPSSFPSSSSNSPNNKNSFPMEGSVVSFHCNSNNNNNHDDPTASCHANADACSSSSSSGSSSSGSFPSCSNSILSSDANTTTTTYDVRFEATDGVGPVTTRPAAGAATIAGGAASGAVVGGGANALEFVARLGPNDPKEEDSATRQDTGTAGHLDYSNLQQRLHTIEGVHAVFGSRLLHLQQQPDVPDQKVVSAVAGTGLAPWEIHRPQKFVRDLVLRRCFSGRVLDAGCGIGDNALYVAKACAGARVTAVDLVPRCLDFANTKAGLRNMRGKVTLAVGDLRQYDSLSDEIRGEPYDVILDSYTFHGFADADRESYVSTLWRLLRPGGLLYMCCMSEEETRPGGPRRVTVEEVRRVFCCGGGGSEGGGEGGDSGSGGGAGGSSSNSSSSGRGSDGAAVGDTDGAGGGSCGGWRLEAIEELFVELHPTFWGGRAKGRLFTLRRRGGS